LATENTNVDLQGLERRQILILTHLEDLKERVTKLAQKVHQSNNSNTNDTIAELVKKQDNLF